MASFDQDYAMQLLFEPKSIILKQSKVFHEPQIRSSICCSVLIALLYQISQGVEFNKKESTELFFACTKLFQSSDVFLRRLVYLLIRELKPSPDDAIIVISCLTKDTTLSSRSAQAERMSSSGSNNTTAALIIASNQLTRGNAIRLLYSLIDNTMLQNIQRTLLQVLVDKSIYICKSALLASQHVALYSPETLKLWRDEFMKSITSNNQITQYHALSLYYKAAIQGDSHQFERQVLTRLQNLPDYGKLSLPTVLNIRAVSRVIDDLYQYHKRMGITSIDNVPLPIQLLEFLRDCLDDSNTKVIILESAKVIINILLNTENEDFLALLSHTIHTLFILVLQNSTASSSSPLRSSSIPQSSSGSSSSSSSSPAIINATKFGSLRLLSHIAHIRPSLFASHQEYITQLITSISKLTRPMALLAVNISLKIASTTTTSSSGSSGSGSSSDLGPLTSIISSVETLIHGSPDDTKKSIMASLTTFLVNKAIQTMADITTAAHNAGIPVPLGPTGFLPTTALPAASYLPILSLFHLMMTSENTIHIKNAVLSHYHQLIYHIPDTSLFILDHLIEHIEDSEYNTLTIRIIDLISKYSYVVDSIIPSYYTTLPISRTYGIDIIPGVLTTPSRSSRYSRTIFNRTILETASVRATAVSAVIRIALSCRNNGLNMDYIAQTTPLLPQQQNSTTTPNGINIISLYNKMIRIVVPRGSLELRPLVRSLLRSMVLRETDYEVSERASMYSSLLSLQLHIENILGLPDVIPFQSSSSNDSLSTGSGSYSDIKSYLHSLPSTPQNEHYIKTLASIDALFLDSGMDTQHAMSYSTNMITSSYQCDPPVQPTERAMALITHATTSTASLPSGPIEKTVLPAYTLSDQYPMMTSYISPLFTSLLSSEATQVNAPLQAAAQNAIQAHTLPSVNDIEQSVLSYLSQYSSQSVDMSTCNTSTSTFYTPMQAIMPSEEFNIYTSYQPATFYPLYTPHQRDAEIYSTTPYQQTLTNIHTASNTGSASLLPSTVAGSTSMTTGGGGGCGGGIGTTTTAMVGNNTTGISSIQSSPLLVHDIQRISTYFDTNPYLPSTISALLSKNNMCVWNYNINKTGDVLYNNALSLALGTAHTSYKNILATSSSSTSSPPSSPSSSSLNDNTDTIPFDTSRLSSSEYIALSNQYIFTTHDIINTPDTLHTSIPQPPLVYIMFEYHIFNTFTDSVWNNVKIIIPELERLKGHITPLYSTTVPSMKQGTLSSYNIFYILFSINQPSHLINFSSLSYNPILSCTLYFNGDNEKHQYVLPQFKISPSLYVRPVLDTQSTIAQFDFVSSWDLLSDETLSTSLSYTIPYDDTLSFTSQITTLLTQTCTRLGMAPVAGSTLAFPANSKSALVNLQALYLYIAPPNTSSPPSTGFPVRTLARFGCIIKDGNIHVKIVLRTHNQHLTRLYSHIYS